MRFVVDDKPEECEKPVNVPGAPPEVHKVLAFVDHDVGQEQPSDLRVSLFLKRIKKDLSEMLHILTKSLTLTISIQLPAVFNAPK